MKKSLKKILCIVLAIGLLSAFAIGLVACNPKSDYEYIKNKGYFVCGITLYEPMNYSNDDGDLVGFETEFANAVAEEMGLTAKFQIINWGSKFMELNGKTIDCIWNGFTVDDERKGQVEFTKSYLNNSQCVVVKQSNLANFANKEACQGKKGVAEAGSAGEAAAKELSSSYIAQSVQTSALTEVLSGTADFAVVDVILANSMVGKGNYTSLAIATGIQLTPEEYAIGFRKGSDMAAKVNDVIDILLENGKLAQIAAKYGLSNALITE